MFCSKKNLKNEIDVDNYLEFDLNVGLPDLNSNDLIIPYY